MKYLLGGGGAGGGTISTQISTMNMDRKAAAVRYCPITIN